MGSTTLWTAAIALSGLTMTSLAMATTTPSNTTLTKQCGSYYESQNYPSNTQNENDDYYHIEPIFFDDAAVQKVRDFASAVDGRWHGTGLDIRCSFTDYSSHTTINNYDVDAEIDKHFQGVLVMEVQQENKDQVNLDRIFLSPETELDISLETELEYNTHGQKTGHRNYEVVFSAPGTLVYNEKYRRFNPRSSIDANGRPAAPFAVRLVHEIKTVSIDKNDLTIHRDVYVNGRFVSQQQWQLERL